MMKGRKLKYSERWSDAELKATVPVLLSTPAGKRLRELAEEIRREHRTHRYGIW